MFKVLLLLNSFFFIGNPPKYTVESIPDVMLEHADLVVRNEIVEIDIISSKKMSEKTKRAITYLGNKKKSIPFVYHYSDKSKIKKINIFVFDATGQIITSFSKKDFTDRSATFGSTFISDDRILHMEYTPKQFPITIEESVELETSTTAFIQAWHPIFNFRLSCQKSKYTIRCPESLGLKYKITNHQDFPINKTEVGGSYSFEIENLPAIKAEALSPSISAITPVVQFSLDNFSLQGYSGVATDWEAMGKWYHEKLLKSQGELTDDAKTEIDNLLNGVTSDLEKAKLIYQFVQDRSRYVSIQLGIGGWKPFSAKEVHKKGYSDCKGLTNYTKALMEHAGVDANYAVIYAGENRRDINPDFCSIQGNHVILCLPNLPNNDTTWLECTSQIDPFGYLGTFTDNRNAWVISENGGAIHKTKYYAPEENLKQTNAKFKLSEEGDIEGYVTSTYEGLFFSKFLYENYLTKDELMKRYKHSLGHLPKLNIENYESTLNKENIVFTDSFQIQSSSYARIGSDDLIFPINIVTRINDLPKRYRKRKLPFRLPRGKQYVDHFEIIIPENYKPSSNIEDLVIDTEFGTYSFKSEYSNNTISCKRKLLLKNGKYPKEKYKAYRDFYKKINTADQQKLRLIKK